MTRGFIIISEERRKKTFLMGVLGMDVYLVKRCHGLDGYTVIDSAWSSEELALTYIHEGLGMVPQRDSEGWTIE